MMPLSYRSEMNLLNPPPPSLSLSSDLVNGLVLLMNSNISSPVNLVRASFSALTFLAEYAVKIGTFKNGICSQGNPEEHTILEFARLIKSLVGKSSHPRPSHIVWKDTIVS